MTSRPRRSEIRTLLSLLPAHRRRGLWRLMALMLVGAATDLLAIGTLIPFLALLVGGGPTTLPDWLLPVTRLGVTSAALLFATFALLSGAFRLLLAWATQSFAVGAGHDIACEVHRRVLLQPYAYHLRQHSSTTVAALQKVEDLVWSLLLPLAEGTVALVIGSAIVAGLMLIDPVPAGVAIGGVLLLYVLVLAVTRPSLRRAAGILNRGWDERVRLVGDSLGGIRDIIVDGSQPLFLQLFRRTDARLASARAKVGLLNVAPRYLIEAIGIALIAVAATVLSRRPGGLAAALPLLGALAFAAQRLLPLMQQLYRGWAALTSRRELIGDIQRLVSLPLPPALEATPSPLPFAREIRLQGIGFAYEERARPVLTDVSFTVAKGSRTAFTGRTGSGKSTLADLMMGLLTPTTGELLVDGVAVGASRAEQWRRNVAHVPQTIFLVDDSLLANIAFGVPAGEVDVARAEEAAALAQLDDLIAELPHGLHSPVGERGVRLSGGQRQRLGLARAIYRQASLLVLDEATNALDPVTEADVLDTLDVLQKRGTTIILIAHRASALAGCDQIIRIEGGRARVVAAAESQPV